LEIDLVHVSYFLFALFDEVVKFLAPVGSEAEADNDSALGVNEDEPVLPR
jgi:hypothetical protein